MKFQNSIKILAIVSIVLFGLSCKNNSQKLVLVYPNKVNYESFIIANHFNYFNENEVFIDVKTVNSGIEAAEAFTLGDAQVAAMGDGPTVMLMGKSMDLAILTRYAEGNRIHRLVCDSALKFPKDLIAKKIGVQQGSSTHGALLSWLQNNNIALADVTIVPLDPKDMPEAMKTNQLDAVAGSEPWMLHVEKLCKNQVHEMANLENDSNNFPHTLVSKTKFATENTEQLKQIVTALNKANEFIHQYPDSASRIAAQYIGISYEEEKICLSRLNWSCGWTEKDASSLMETARFFMKSRKIDNLPVVKTYLKIIQF